jgi:hypothetical protein
VNLHDLDHPQVQVDAAAAKPSHLADPKAAKGTQQRQRPIAGPDAVRQPSNLSRGQKRISRPSILGSGTRRQGFCAIMPASTAAPSTLPSSW